MGKRYLIDTNVLLDYVARILPLSSHLFVENVVSDSFNVSIINRIEVLGHASADQNLEDFMDLANTYLLLQDITNQTIALRKIR
jgi:toxin FitB